MTRQIDFSATSSNYFELNGDTESLNMLTISTNVDKVNLSFGLGVDSSYIFADKQDVKNNLALEVKAKYNITKDLNLQGRFRKIGDAEQYRLAFGGSYKFDSKNLIYASAHLTTKHTAGDLWKTNTGGWIGYTHKFENCSLSAELQKNFSLDKTTYNT